MFNAAVVGHLCLDFTPRLDHGAELVAGQLRQVGPLGLSPGGCVPNTGLSLLQLGASVRLAADVGDDELGRLLEDRLRTELAHIDDPTRATLQLRRVRGASTSYSMVLQRPGSDRILLHHVGANGTFDGTALDLDGIDLLHVGYPPLLPGLVAGGALGRLLQRAAAAGATTSLDLAVIDPDSDVGREDWPALLAGVLPAVGVFSPSLDDLGSVYHRAFANDPEVANELAGTMISSGAAIVAITCGEGGIVLRSAGVDRLRRGGRVLAALAPGWADRRLWVPAPATEVVTTNGAGDAATAGLLWGLLQGQAPEDALLSAALCAEAKVSGQRRLPRYASGAMASQAVPRQQWAGWTAGRRGVLRAPGDREDRDDRDDRPDRETWNVSPGTPARGSG